MWLDVLYAWLAFNALILTVSVLAYLFNGGYEGE